MVAQNNAIRTNHIKARLDKTQQNNGYRLCGNRDETINPIWNGYGKLAQKEHKTTHNWVARGFNGNSAEIEIWACENGEWDTKTH